MIIATYSVYGYEKSSPLPRFDPKVKIDDIWRKCSLSAGLPYFSTSWMRTWGRDTMISIRGLFLTTERYEEAKFF